MVDFLTASDIPMTLYWGSHRRIIYNDAAVAGFGNRAAVLGLPGSDVWGDWWPPIADQLAEVEAIRRSLTILDTPFAEHDGPRAREIYWNLTYWPVFEADGTIGGILCAARDTTADVFRKRLDRLLVELDNALGRAETLETATSIALKLIAEQLHADRVGFGEIDLASRTIEIRQVWSTPDMPDIRGRYPLGAFGDITDALSRGEIAIIDNIETDARMADPAVRERTAKMGMQSGLIVPILHDGRYAGGVFAQCAMPRNWMPFDIVIAEAATQRLWNALQWLRTSIALKASEQRYRLIFEQAEDIIFTADIDQIITDCNAAGAQAMGMAREDIIGRSIADFVSIDDFQQTTAMLQHKIDHGGHTRHEISVAGRDGTAMRWENNSTLVIDSDDRPIGLLSISRDVTERRAFDERRELLIHELNHRVKNTLALVQAIAHQSFPAGSTDADARDRFIARLRTLAAAHDLLTREHWEGVTLAELARAATATFDSGGNRVAIHGPEIRLTPKAAVALAMAFHELGTNAAKYGALSVEEGKIDLNWHHTADGFVIEWQERGGPRVISPDRRGFGMRMIERALASDLGGKVDMTFAPGGLECRIEAKGKENMA